MKASEIKFVDLFTGANTRYTIPVYQRNYSWTTAQCMQLWNDLKNLEPGKNHFFGSVVLSFEANGEHQVIDGQQRLTTVSLLWAAMLRLFPKKERLTMGYLANMVFGNVCYATGVGQFAPRIEHVERDRAPYQAIIGEKDTTQHKESRVFQNFDFFCRNLRDFTAEERKAIYDATCRLTVVRIDLQQGDNPQLIFESLNATGLRLTDGDKIRNYLLMNVAPQQQEVLYRQYWVALEKYTKSIRPKNDEDHVTLFFREYMATKEGRYTQLPRVYSHFKKIAKGAENVEDLLNDATRAAHLLSQFVNASTGHNKVDAVAHRLTYLNFSTVYPFAMNVLNSLQKGDITEDDAADTFHIVEAYLTRRIVCGLPSNALNKIMPTLYADAKEMLTKDGDRRLPETVAAILTRKSGSGTFPTDEKFAKAWETKDIYSMKGNVRSYILAMFNETMPNGHLGKEAQIESTVTKLTGDKKTQATLSVEHVMPQTLSDDWKTDLGGEEAANAIHERWLHTIANLTITGYNPELSNNTFDEKVKVFEQSPLPINSYIKKQTHWGEMQLEERLKQLADNANRIWPRPKMTGFDNEATYDDLTADSPYSDFTKTWFISGSVCGDDITQPVWKNWKSVFCTVLKRLDIDFHSDMVRMADDPKKHSLRNENTKDKNSLEIADGVYAQLNGQSTAGLASLLRGIVDYIGLDRDQIRFRVQPYGADDLQADADFEVDEELD